MGGIFLPLLNGHCDVEKPYWEVLIGERPWVTRGWVESSGSDDGSYSGYVFS